MSKQPDSLENKFRILSLLPFDRRIGRKHSAVMAFILDWHHRKYGDALASVRHIVAELKTRDPFGKGFFTGDVHGALTDLVEWGYLSQQKGSGRRASRYVPVWNIFDSVRELPNTTETEISVLESPNTTVRESPNATDDCVRESQNQDPLTRTRLLDRVTEEEGTTLPHHAADALGGAAGGAGEEGDFERLWKAYGYRRKKAEAKAEFAKLDPTAEGMAKLIDAATAWRDAWAAQGKADAPRKHLHIWLRDECWDEDPPVAFKPKERKQAQPKAEQSEEALLTPSNDNNEPELHVLHRVPSRVAPGRYDATIVASQVDSDVDGTKTASLHMQIADTAFTLGIVIESRFRATQEEGQGLLTQLIGATGLVSAENSSELHDRPFILEVDVWGSPSFHRAADGVAA